MDNSACSVRTHTHTYTSIHTVAACDRQYQSQLQMFWICRSSMALTWKRVRVHLSIYRQPVSQAIIQSANQLATGCVYLWVCIFLTHYSSVSIIISIQTDSKWNLTDWNIKMPETFIIPRSVNECWKKTAGFDDDNKKPVCTVAVPVSGDCKRMKKLLYLHLQSLVVWTMKRNWFNTRSSIASGEGYFTFTPLPSNMFVHFDLLNEFFTFTCSSITKQTNECIETNDPNRMHTASNQITTDPYETTKCQNVR